MGQDREMSFGERSGRVVWAGCLRTFSGALSARSPRWGYGVSRAELKKQPPLLKIGATSTPALPCGTEFTGAGAVETGGAAAATAGALGSGGNIRSCFLTFNFLR